MQLSKTDRKEMHIWKELITLKITEVNLKSLLQQIEY